MHIRQSRFDGILDVSASTPQVELRRGSSLVLATVSLSLGQKLRCRWLAAKLVKLINSGTPVKLNSALGLVYVGIYSGGFDTIGRPSGVPLNVLNLYNSSYKNLNPYFNRDFTSPDTYEVIAVNNTSNLDFDIVVSSVLRCYADG